jgi:divalent metal cation (Fe/Co/Zn/Cd) transporter
LAGNVLRATAVSRGVRLEILTVAWMAAEGAAALAAGIAAGSVLLIAFGFDSIIELLSGVVVLRRLLAEAGRAPAGGMEKLEAWSDRASAALLVLLCVFVLGSSAAGLAFQLRPEGSALGVIVAAVAIVVMPLLALAKARVNRVIDSASLKADIAETITCAYMAGATLLGLALSMLLGLWWLQYIAALALLIWLVPETREAIESARGRAH